MSERRISEKSLENLRKSNQESNLLTREAIETALLQLLEKKDLTKISISELVKRAGVSRAAFYRNYDSKEEILESVFKRSVHNIMEQLHHYDLKTDLYLVWVHLFPRSKKGSQSDSIGFGLPSGKNLCPSHAGISRKIPWKIKRCQLLSSFLLEFSHRLSPSEMDQGWHEGTC